MFKQTLIAAALLAAGYANAALPVTVTQWNFNSPIADANTGTGTTSASTGSGVASLLGGMTSTFASGDANSGSSDPATGDDSGWNLSTFAAQSTGDRTRGAQFTMSTVGYQDVVFSYDLRHSNTSAMNETVQYSLDGVNFVTGAQFSGNAGDTWFKGRTLDLTTVTGANNNANLTFRVLASFAPSTSLYAASSPTGTYGTTGTWRFDMVTASAVAAVPEPETYAMLMAGLGLIGLVRRRRQA